MFGKGYSGMVFFLSDFLFQKISYITPIPEIAYKILISESPKIIKNNSDISKNIRVQKKNVGVQ